MTHKNPRFRLKPVIHRTEVLHAPGGRRQPISIDEYIEEASREMTATRLRNLAKSTAEMSAKMATEQARPHADLHDYTAQLIRLFESDQVKHCKDPLDKILAEAGVAAEYLLKGMDLIPDRVPEIGLTDDARVVSRVFTRNPELMEIA